MNWIIERLYVKAALDGLNNVVITADWRVNGVQGNYAATCYGQVSFVAPDSADFTPFEDLTQEQVLQWVWDSGVNKAACEESVNKQIADQINPPILTPPLPWLNV